ncbi:MAG: hypothetical protein KGI50_00115 [Patescibacteria group bacterium]|nr:hypothetical protein [Patescibacteria group bacterium]MDE2438234.1 hypothetical protein [Patescibacteria group bacterium]
MPGETIRADDVYDSSDDTWKKAGTFLTGSIVQSGHKGVWLWVRPKKGKKECWISSNKKKGGRKQ